MWKKVVGCYLLLSFGAMVLIGVFIEDEGIAFSIRMLILMSWISFGLGFFAGKNYKDPLDTVKDERTEFDA